ncbi:MAG: preprotein translocase subunit YajC [Thermoleophilia bacterium]|nr:preprotein translocase subunit YajC [Thermoleophilia bacterium]
MFQVLVFLGLGSVAWYLLIVLPQKKQHGTHERTLGQLGIGSNVMTVGGIFGRVQTIEGDTIVLEIAPGMVTRVASDGIARIVAGGEVALPTPTPSQHHAPQPTVAMHAVAETPARQHAPVSAQQAPAPQNEAVQMHEHTPHQQPGFGQLQQPSIHPQFMGQPQQLQPPQYAPAQHQQPTFSPQQPPHHMLQPVPVQFGQQTGEHTTLRATPQPAAGYQPRPFTAFALPAPPVFGRAPAPQPAQPQYQPPALQYEQQQSQTQHYVDPQQHYVPPQQYTPEVHQFAPAPGQQYAPSQPQPQQYAPVQQQYAPMHAPQHQYEQQPHEYSHAPVQQGAAAPMPQLAPQQQQFQPQQVAPQVQAHELPQQQHAVAPAHFQQQGAPAMHQGANPDTYDASTRTHSNAPEGMGANLRLDDPSLAEIVDRARRERAELADEYRRLNDPMVMIDQVQPHAQQQVQYAAQQQIVMQHQPHTIAPHAMVQQQQHGQPQLFVQPHAQIAPPAPGSHQFPMPAIPPSVDGHARPNIATVQGAVPAPSAAAFYRAAPYAPQHEAAATPA